MDHTQEQLEELEALRSIFFDEFAEPDVPTTPASFTLLVTMETYYGPQPAPQYHLKVTYTPEYPETLPVLTITQPVALDLEEVQELTQLLIESAQTQLGMAMVFGIHAAAKEALETYVGAKAERIEREREERLAAEEEAERLRTAGTKVTMESFLAWRKEFFVEMAASEKKKLMEKLGGPNSAMAKALVKQEANKGKLSGRALFEKDKTLAKSDAALMGADDVDVDVAAEVLLAEAEGLEDDDEDSDGLHFSDDDD
ncbi:RWD domain-containing protein 1 [Podochytrium sp. JEL0797]|nr:RWD domain-containing protein 1 [Podochytrium sp. JEL0797]